MKTEEGGGGREKGGTSKTHRYSKKKKIFKANFKSSIKGLGGKKRVRTRDHFRHVQLTRKRGGRDQEGGGEIKYLLISLQWANALSKKKE